MCAYDDVSFPIWYASAPKVAANEDLNYFFARDYFVCVCGCMEMCLGMFL